MRSSGRRCEEKASASCLKKAAAGSVSKNFHYERPLHGNRPARPPRRPVPLFDVPVPSPRPNKFQTVCKPGSVHAEALDGHSSGTRLAARLARPTRAADRKPSRVLVSRRSAGRPYSVLLPVGFTLPALLPRPRCALTAPFHPYRRHAGGGLFSVALSLGSPPPAVSRHRVSVEPGLSSSGLCPPAAVQPSGSCLLDLNRVARQPPPRNTNRAMMTAMAPN